MSGFSLASKNADESFRYEFKSIMILKVYFFTLSFFYFISLSLFIFLFLVLFIVMQQHAKADKLMHLCKFISRV